MGTQPLIMEVTELEIGRLYNLWGSMPSFDDSRKLLGWDWVGPTTAKFLGVGDLPALGDYRVAVFRSDEDRGLVLILETEFGNDTPGETADMVRPFDRSDV